MAGLEDPMRFIKAEEFYGRFQSAGGPKSLKSVQSSNSSDSKDPLRYAALLTFDDGSTSLFQFVTPQLWRIRFVSEPSAQPDLDYPDANTRTIVQNSFASLVDELQVELARKAKASNLPNSEGQSCWATKFEELSDGSGWILSSIQYKSSKEASAGLNGTTQIKAFFRKTPFQIQCTRVLNPQGDTYNAPPGLQAQAVEKVIWQTAPGRTFVHSKEYPIMNNVILNVAKPGPAEFVGFGEQGGRDLLKARTFMNYFCYDNLGYSKVYGKGPLDDREPLYHSQPFYMQLNGTPGYHNVTATLIDNYSQVFMDIGKTNAGRIGMGTRFGTFDVYILAADKVSQIIWLFTSIIGRPQLKPRYVLGHHQGGYGYEKTKHLTDVVSGYHSTGIPLDGLHIDVDFQHKYRTFTTDDTNFPNVKQMFTDFRNQGIKCCTNITPIISFDGYKTDNDSYPTINAAWDSNDHKNPAKNFLIRDNRFEDGLPDPADKRIDYLRYLSYEGGKPQVTYANDLSQRNEPNTGRDVYDVYTNYNSGYPFHGGVSYGDKLGISGFYPDLNRKVVREKFWAKQYEDLFDKGLEFIWQDMTTPAVGRCYGDMLGFPGRLLVSTDPYEQDDNTLPPQKTAMELWALYSYNLHKATYKGLQALPQRKGKRNFIIGRGSSTGMHRYAGLWTGDNRSTWSFWRICVAEVLACGLGGISIAGVDMGGFFPSDDKGKWCDPNLFIRWYSGAFLLPWYRNHYMGKEGQEAKLFQEVYQFSSVFSRGYYIPPDQRDLYNSVQPVCKYYVRLRYSLMQALYDRMFENLINGLPIARSMLITDPDDATLFNEAAEFVNNQYLLGHHILVAPFFNPDNETDGSRDVYLPRPSNWYPFNLRIDDPNVEYGVRLAPPVEGGSIVNWNKRITSDIKEIPYLTPMFIREGAFIPKIDVRLYVGDGKVNPITMHVYPGNGSWYSMFLDDGVSRDSAPGWLAQYKNSGDDEAKGKYREVRFEQQSIATTRTLTISHKWNHYNPTKEIGDTYTIVLWMDANQSSSPSSVTFKNKDGQDVAGCSYNYRPDIGATVLTVPTRLAGALDLPANARDADALIVEHSTGSAVLNGVSETNGVNGVNGTH